MLLWELEDICSQCLYYRLSLILLIIINLFWCITNIAGEMLNLRISGNRMTQLVNILPWKSNLKPSLTFRKFWIITWLGDTWWLITVRLTTTTKILFFFPATISDLKVISLSRARHFATPWTISWNSPGQNIGVGSLSLLQGIFPTEGSNSGLPGCR